MDEGIPHLQERQLLEHRDFIGLDYSSLYMCKPKRSMKRDDSKTLGHLEKAVVLELTLKHLKALTALTEQQHQKIIALQNGERSLKSPIQSDLDAFHSGFQTCAKEVLQYLARFESWTPREPRCVQLINHLHAVATQFLPTPQLLTQQVPLSKGTGAPTTAPAGSVAAACLERAGQKLEPLAHCVPVIQRTQPSAELAAENDTDTDSGYGGEAEARPDREKGKGAGASRVTIKQEPPGEDSPAPKRMKLDSRGGGGGPGGGAAAAAAALLGPDPAAAAALLRPDAALLSSLVAFGGGGGAPFAQPAAAAAPFCLPFYFLSPSAAAAYVQPFLDKSGLEKYLYPAAAAAHSHCYTPESPPRPPPPQLQPPQPPQPPSPACPQCCRPLRKRQRPPPPRPSCRTRWRPPERCTPRIRTAAPTCPSPAPVSPGTQRAPLRKITRSQERKAPDSSRPFLRKDQSSRGIIILIS
uniref:Orange domain-containing protein n=1 Tax=Sus scrofa TaxID=9823 RepID=A0A4X1VHK1_PIG